MPTKNKLTTQDTSGVLKSAPNYLALSGLRTQHLGMFISETTLLRASSETWMNDLDTPTAIANHWEVTAAVGVTMSDTTAEASPTSPTDSSVPTPSHRATQLPPVGSSSRRSGVVASNRRKPIHSTTC